MRRVLGLLLLVAACSAEEGGVTTIAVGDQTTTPDAIAQQVTAALASGDPAAMVPFTDLEPMSWIALAEGSTVEEAAGLGEEEVAAVGVNFWSGFLGSANLAGEAGEVTSFEEGNTSFARVDLPEGSFVLKAGESWKVDLVASFSAPLAESLMTAIEVVIANPSPAADELRAMLAAQRDSVAVAASDPSLSPEARALVDEILRAVSALG